MSQIHYANKIILDGEVLIDLTQDTITEEDVLNGKTFHKANGEIATGSLTLTMWDGSEGSFSIEEIPEDIS